MDGWWIEGHLEDEVVPLCYRDPGRWAEVMRRSIAAKASFFNTHRMVGRYSNVYV